MPSKKSKAKQRPRLSPTRFGWTIIALIALSWLMAINYSNNLLYAVVCLWISLLLSSGLLAWLQFRQIQAGSWDIDEIYAQSINKLVLHYFRNGFSGPVFIDGHTPSLECHWYCSPQLSGRQVLQPPALCGYDTLGLWKLTKILPKTQELVVFSRAYAHTVLPTIAFGNSQDHEPEEIKGFKQYASGDEFRHIDWSASARSGHLTLREWEGNQPSTVYDLNWQALPHLNPEQKQQTLTAWVNTIAGEQDSWSLILPEGQLPVGKGEKHRRDCLIAIAEVVV